jgi:hypothetical protein
MATIVTRAGKGSPLTNNEVDANFNNLNAEMATKADLSSPEISAQALHRSPNAISAMHIYDTSKDSDGGAWTEQCQHTSWWNEPLTNIWLGAQASESEARNVGAVLGPELVTNGNFASGSTGWTTGTGWVVGGGVAAFSNPSNGFLTQPVTFASGKTYKIVFSVNYTSGAYQIQLNGGGTDSSATISAGGERTLYITATGARTEFRVLGVGGGSFSIDNISVREIVSLTTVSGDYYQLTTDGKFYRLWKNQLRWSQSFTVSGWFVDGAVVTPSTGLAPDGTTTATSIALGTGSSRIYQFDNSGVLGNKVFSLYVKAGAGSIITIAAVGGTSPSGNATVNAAAGTVSGLAGASIVGVGDGWYRVSLPVNVNTASGNSTYWTIGATGAAAFIWGAQLELGSTATAYEFKGTEGTVSEVFRGNKRDFPRLAGIVAENATQASVTIYDLTEVGRPMWGRFAVVDPAAISTFLAYTANNTIANSNSYGFSLSALNGVLAIGVIFLSGANGNVSGLRLVDFAADRLTYSTAGVSSRVFTLNIAQRNQNFIGNGTNVGAPSIASGAVNAVAMTVLPDAPTDIATDLRIPTIAVATTGGVTVIKHNGTTVNSSSAASHTLVAISNRGDLYAQLASQFYTARSIGSLPNSFAWLSPNLNSVSPPILNEGNTVSKIVSPAGGNVLTSDGSGRVFMLRDHSTQARGLGAKVGGAFNTGWMTGDIRRCFMSDTAIGAVTGSGLVTGDSSTFDTTVGSWVPTASFPCSLSVVNGTLEMAATSTSGRAVLPVNVVAGRTYRVTGQIRRGTSNSSSFWVTTTSNANSGTAIASYAPAGNSFETFSLLFTPTQSTVWLSVLENSGVGGGVTTYVDNIRVTEVVADRSYKAQSATINGTLTRSQLATGTSLVAYSGFSAANYLQEPYSADLDFGTGEWSASAWVNVPTVLPAANFPVVGTNLFTGQTFVKEDANGSVSTYNNSTRTLSVTNTGTTGNGYPTLKVGLGMSLSRSYEVEVQLSGTGLNYSAVRVWAGWANPVGGIPNASGYVKFKVTPTATDSASLFFNLGSLAAAPYSVTIDSLSVREIGPSVVAERARSTGPRIRLGVDFAGRIYGDAFDGTTTRTVITSNSYSAAQWLKAEACYTADGSLAIMVNGREVAVTRGAPLLTLSSRYNQLTFTEQFDNPIWGKVGSSVFANQDVGNVTLGPELVTNGGFATDTAWTKGSGWSIAGDKASITSAVGTPILEQNVGLTTNGVYKVALTISDRTAGNIIIRMGSGTNVATFSANGTYELFLSAGGAANFQLIATSGSTLSVDNVSVRLVTPAAATSPDGTNTADALVEDISTGLHYVTQSFTSIAATYTMSCYLKAAGRNFAFLYFPLTNTGAAFNLTTGEIGQPSGTIAPAFSSAQDVGNGWWRVSMTVVGVAGGTSFRVYLSDSLTGNGSYAGNGTSGILIWGGQLQPVEANNLVLGPELVVNGGFATDTNWTKGTGWTISGGVAVATAVAGFEAIFQNIGAVAGKTYQVAVTATVTSGSFGVGLGNNGQNIWAAPAASGIYTAVVTTSTAAGNGSVYIRGNPTVTGTIDNVSVREITSVTGMPNTYQRVASVAETEVASLTIGNNFAADAPFVGSIALLKLGATVPTPEQAVFMYEQEKQLFRAGALSVMPDSGAIVDMTYDDATDRWMAISPTNESYWTGLVRNSVTPVPAGSYTRIVAGSGLDLVARSTTNSGVDVTIPASGLREELLKRSETAAKLNAQLATFDYVGGFTASTTAGSTAITSVAGITYPASYIGAVITGSGIPANTTVLAVSGTTIQLSRAATVTATGVTISFQDFILPFGLEAKEVSLAGVAQREGSTAQFTRLFDGFKETIRFGTAPSNTALVQIQAVRTAS